MPEIQDYRHADCNLFRTPPLDFSKLDSTLIDTLVSSWKNGYTADNALQKVVEDTSLVRELTKQVAEQLTFQRRTELEQLKSEEKAFTKKAKKEQAEAIEQFEHEYQTDIEQAKVQAETLRTEYDSKKQAYTETQRSVDEMRQRVQERLEAVGGERSLETLFEINKALLGERVIRTPGKVARPLTPSQSITQEVRTYLPPQPQKDTQIETPKTFIQKKREHTFLGKLWRMLNYEIW